MWQAQSQINSLPTIASTLLFNKPETREGNSNFRKAAQLQITRRRGLHSDIYEIRCARAGAAYADMNFNYSSRDRQKVAAAASRDLFQRD